MQFLGKCISSYRRVVNLWYYSLCSPQCWSDVDLTLRNYFKEQGLIDVVITGGPGSENEDLYYKIREYPNGMSQPGILLVKPDLTVVYSWASQPKKVSVNNLFTITLF